MARKGRIQTPGAIYHVMLRGNARQDIFSDDKDRYRFYTVLDGASQRFDHRLLAFCLMRNHAHLEIQVGKVALSKIMQNMSQQYTQWFNWRHNRPGHVFQGRYKAIMVDADEYLLELAAYIHLNPVRAHVSEKPDKYRWSSHRAYLGKESFSWLDTSLILSQFSSNPKKAGGLFAEFVGGRVTERRKEFHGEKNHDSRIFGDDNFVEAVFAETESEPLRKPDVFAVIASVKKIYDLPDDIFRGHSRERGSSEARGVAAWATIELSSGKLKELARYLGRDASTLTCAVRRVEKLRVKNPLLREKMVMLREELAESSSQGLAP